MLINCGSTLRAKHVLLEKVDQQLINKLKLCQHQQVDQLLINIQRENQQVDQQLINIDAHVDSMINMLINMHPKLIILC